MDCAMTERDAAAADELKKFCLQLAHTAQFKSKRNYTVGSHVELVAHRQSMRACGLNMDTADVDYMYYSIDRYAFPLKQRVPHEYNGTVLRIYTDSIHPGYARLIDEKSDVKFGTNLI
jgi:hypothetical protein